MKKCILFLLCCCFMAIPVFVHADIITLGSHLITDGSWLSRGGESMSTEEADMWNQAGFNPADPRWADHWATAFEDYPLSSLVNLDECIPGTEAKAIWHYPEGIPSGKNGDLSAYFRKEFTLDLPDGYAKAACVLQMVVDDDCAVYLDGNLVLLDDDGKGTKFGYSELGYYERKDPLLLNVGEGTHVLAIYAADGSLFAPHDLLYEALVVDAYFTLGDGTSVPEPSCTALMFVGLSVVGLIGGRNSRKRDCRNIARK